MVNPIPKTQKDVCSKLFYFLAAGFIIASYGCSKPNLSFTEDSRSIEERHLVEKAQHTLESFMAQPNLVWLRDIVTEAPAILIFPQHLKGAFPPFGAAGGSGVMIVRSETAGMWHGPAFYMVGSLSFGPQIGGQVSEMVLVVRNLDAVEKFYSSSIKLGVDASIAIGPYGAGIEGATSTNLGADILAFGLSKGIFAGVSLDGAFIKTDNSANEAYYGEPVEPIDILLTRRVSSTHADRLRETIAESMNPTIAK